MGTKKVIEDIFDPRPIKRVTVYAIGTGLEGIALGLFITICFPMMTTQFRLFTASAFFIVGVILAVSAYSNLKRKYIIVERTFNNSE
mgnify:CR=1 FL=1